MLPAARVGVLVEVGAIEKCEAVSVTREMRGGPIEKDAEAFLMAAVHKIHEIGRRAEPAGDSVISGCLIAPGSVERMLHNGQELDMGKTHPLHVRNELIRQLP